MLAVNLIQRQTSVNNNKTETKLVLLLLVRSLTAESGVYNLIHSIAKHQHFNHLCLNVAATIFTPKHTCLLFRNTIT